MQSKRGPLALTFAVLILLLVYKGRFYQCGSFDFVQHLLLVDEIMRHGYIRPSPLPIGVMASYPPLSHWMAAAVGWIGGSGVVGIVLVTIAATFACYLLITTALSSTAAIVLFVAAFYFLIPSQSLIGWEIESNYFYPQLVSTVVFLAAIIVAPKMPPVRRSIALVAAGIVTMWIQPVGAIHIFALACMMCAVEVISARADRRAFLHACGLLLLTACASAAGVLLHPSFEVMVMIAANNGDLWLGYKHIMLVAVICGAIGAANLIRNRSRIDMALGCAAMASLGVMLLQFAALKLHGDGSVYAVKKHVFIVFTLGVMNGVRIVASFFGERAQALRPWLSPIAAGIMTLFAMHNFDKPVMPLLHAIEFADGAVTSALPGFAPGNTVDDDANKPLMERFIVTLISFQHGFDGEAVSWLKLENPISKGATYIMRSRGSVPACADAEVRGDQFEIVRASCVAQR
jgi:hypothetical protein